MSDKEDKTTVELDTDVAQALSDDVEDAECMFCIGLF